MKQKIQMFSTIDKLEISTLINCHQRCVVSTMWVHVSSGSLQSVVNECQYWIIFQFPPLTLLLSSIQMMTSMMILAVGLCIIFQSQKSVGCGGGSPSSSSPVSSKSCIIRPIHYQPTLWLQSDGLTEKISAVVIAAAERLMGLLSLSLYGIIATLNNV